MIIVNRQDTRKVLLSVEYKDENELKNVFVSNVSELLSGVATIEAKSFIYIKELNDEVDVALIGNDGSLFLAETKLARNSDARRIVAQLLGYAAKLKSKSFKDFEDQWMRKSSNNPKTLLAELKNNFGNEVKVLDQLKENWEKRRFNLILVMDKISDEIREMAETLKDMPNWFIYGIELTKYAQNDQKIYVPNILWEEEVRSVTSRGGQIHDDSEFLESYKKAGLGKQIEDFISLFVEFENKKSIDNIEVYRSPKMRNYKISNGVVTIGLHYDPKYEGGRIQFWCYKKGEDEKVIEILKRYDGMEKTKPLKKSFGKIGEWDLKYFSKEKFKEMLQNLSEIE